ncbi:cupin domain-containing protein [Fodinicola acaciae]|uniref:cupin domain-containing protein n=1 Tax=Fodinicola acaciae TaxID=2681555 RepID=UPI0013D28D23|nr:cupin domain-containing protein [Fodinicola acaciae]
MTMIRSDEQGSILVREADAERLGTEKVGMILYADHDQTGGALSANRALIADGMDGAAPHFHNTSAEIFFIVDGSLQVLAGDDVVTAEKGDFLFVPPKMPHAFGAPKGSSADVLILFAPGLARFDYFRLVDKVARGKASPQEVLRTQDLFDNHFMDSAIWRAVRDS